jgi:DNA-binding beta-propeller fold protein YncE
VCAAALGLGLAGTGCNSDTTQPKTTVSCPDDPGTICTWAGDGVPGFDGGGRPLLESHLYWPADVTFAPSGQIYIVDWNNHIIREVVDGKLVTRIGTAIVGDGPLPGSEYSDLVEPGAPGTEISLNHPTELLPLPSGKLLLLAWHNHKLRTYDPSTGLVLVVCGAGAGFAGDGGPAENALLNQPQQGAMDSQGNLYILDQRNQRIRKIDGNDVITTVAGTGVAGFGGDGGDPLQAQFAFPAGSNPPPAGAVVCDGQGRLYVTDSLNNRVRRIDFNANIITTVAGNGAAAFGGDGGPAVDASLNNPRDLEFGPDGRLYIADENNNRVRALDLDTGIITTVAGNGEAAFAGDGGPAVDASLNRPSGLAFDDQGRLYIGDTYNHRIRRVTL